MAPTPSHRLPRTVRPERYDLEIAADLEAGTFTGAVIVDLHVDKAVDEIVLNAADLEFHSAELLDAGGASRPGTIRALPDAEQVAVAFDEALAPGSARRLRLRFGATLGDGLRGFYRSTFTDAEGVTHVIGTTQFESTDARRAFPCWDEPDFKATFAVTLVVPEGLTALSSGACVSDEPAGDGRRRLRFAETIPMSTYVLAWVIGPFELTEPVDAGGFPLRLVAPRGREPLTRFGLQVAVHALGYLSSYFGLPYPGDKLDHVAIPDFAFGAMENLGCVTYRETALLADPATASQAELMRVAEVVAHETAHMWFGNLVTMKWWNGIWLNEAFATFMELKVAEDFRPDWDVWAAQSAAKAEALAIDGLRTTRSVEFEVAKPEDAEAMFDVLTYEKGGSVLRMLEQFLGEETFRRGIARYLTEHRFANTETTDLWDALEAESGQPVRATMDSWIFQAGYPLVTVEASADGAGVTLSARRFSYLGDVEGEWRIPVSLRASVAGEVVRRRVLLDTPTTVDLGGPVDWVVANEAGAGFYRVRYEPGLVPPLADLDPLERVHLVNDTWAAVVAGTTGLDEWLALVTGLGVEDDPDVWRAVAGPLRLLEHAAGAAERPQLRQLVADVAGPAFAALGWDAAKGETARRAGARGRLIGLLGTTGADPDVRAEAESRHRRFRQTGSGLSPDVLTAVATTIAASGGPEAYERLLRCYHEGATPQDRIRYLLALASFEDPEEARRTLDLALSPDVRSQDGPLVIGAVLAGPVGASVAWPWIEEHLDAIIDRFPRNLLVRVFEGLPSVVDAGVAERAHRFLDAHPLPVGGPRLAQIEEQLDITVALAARLDPMLGAELGRRVG